MPADARIVGGMISGNGGGQGSAVEFTAETARAMLHEACASAGLDPTGAELLRIGSNAVYRLVVDSGNPSGVDQAVSVAEDSSG